MRAVGITETDRGCRQSPPVNYLTNLLFLLFSRTGVSSDFFSGHGDRRFTFKCCNDKDFDHADCHHSRLLKGDFNFKVDRDKRFYITGINSYYIAGKR